VVASGVAVRTQRMAWCDGGDFWIADTTPHHSQQQERQATTEANRYQHRLETLKRLLALRDKSFDESELAVSEMSSSVKSINLRLTERESVRTQKQAVSRRLSAAVGDLEKQLQLSSSKRLETAVRGRHEHAYYAPCV